MKSENQEEVWLTLFGDLQSKKPNSKVGDKVRLSKMKKSFNKGYLPDWTKELFLVAKAISSNHPNYKIKDLNNQILQRTFYDSELQKVYKNNYIFKIESIVERRRRNNQQGFFVKWLGYSESFNSWIQKHDIVQYI